MKKIIFMCLVLTTGIGLLSSCEPDYVTDANNNGNQNPTNNQFVVNVTSGSKSGTTFTSAGMGAGVATQAQVDGKTMYLLVVNYSNWALAGGFNELDNSQFTFVGNSLVIKDPANNISYESIEDQGQWNISNIQVIRDVPGANQKIVKCKVTFSGKFNITKDFDTIEENVELNGTLNFQ